MISKELQDIIKKSLDEAIELNYEYLITEHLLLVLLKEVIPQKAHPVTVILNNLNVNIDEIVSNLSEYIKHENRHSSNKIITEPIVTFERIIDNAVSQVISDRRDEVTCFDVIASILSINEKNSHANYLLQSSGVDWERFTTTSSEKEAVMGTEDDDADNQKTALSRYTSNLNQLAKEQKIDPLIGRSQEIERVIQVLSRRRKNHPILVGEAGVGKTAIAEGLAWLIEQKKVPQVLADSVIYSFNVSTLVEGTSYRGSFEKKFNQLVTELQNQDNSILFIDEIHMIVGAGSAGESKLDIANLLKPLLSSSKIRVIGSTTYHEYSRIIEKDNALSRRFQKIDIEEPSISETIEILCGLKSQYEQHHHVEYTKEAITSAVNLSVKYINNRCLPDKAIDIIDEAGSRNAILPEEQRQNIIDVADIEKTIAKIARISESTVSVSDKSRLQQLVGSLKSTVFGQNKAIENLSDAIILNRAGLGETLKPIGSFLFAGPTGVGKTEVTIQLAKVLNIQLLRFDMSEYREPHSISKLIGSPPGYVGYEQGGLLTDQVIKHPHAVLLLDEIEKAHPDIYNLLLQIMDNGTLTDNNGRHVNFRNIILIMTTNAGVQETTKKSIGFSHQDNSSDAMIEINRVFSPEFRNRLDNIIWFDHLNQTIILQIVDKFIQQLKQQLHDKKVQLIVSEETKTWLAKKGYDKSMGARPMSRIIQEHIKKPIAHQLLFGKLQKGGTVTIELKENGLCFNYSENEGLE